MKKALSLLLLISLLLTCFVGCGEQPNPASDFEYTVRDDGTIEITKYIGIDETTKRYYPNDTLASVVLGFVGSDEQGLAGIESYYDSIEICDSHNFKYAIVARNHEMIDRSDMVVVYVKNESGGAYQSLKYAEKNQKRIINLYHTPNEE